MEISDMVATADTDLYFVRQTAQEICDEYPPEFHANNPGFYGQLVVALMAREDSQRIAAAIARLTIEIGEISKSK